MSVGWRRAMKPAERSWQTLVVVPCGKAKAWEHDLTLPPFLSAERAYVGPLFRLNRQYAAEFGDRWIILSAKYGFIWPGTLIEDYDVQFGKPKTCPIDYERLRRQVARLKLYEYRQVIVLGGKDYCAAASAAFARMLVHDMPPLEYPFVGRPIGRMLRAIKQAIAVGRKQ